MVLLCTCQVETKIELNKPAYFDLNSFFDAQLKELNTYKKIKKTTAVDSIQVEKILDSLDFTIELQAFRDSDINKVAWIGKYQIDSLNNDKGELSRIDYTAEDEKLRTRQITISYKDDLVDSIKIFNYIPGAVSVLKQNLLYVPKYGYSIVSSQKTTLSKEHVLAVDVKFVY